MNLKTGSLSKNVFRKLFFSPIMPWGAIDERGPGGYAWATVSLELGFTGPVSRDGGFIRPVSIAVGLIGPVSLEVGFIRPVSLEVGFKSPFILAGRGGEGR